MDAANPVCTHTHTLDELVYTTRQSDCVLLRLQHRIRTVSYMCMCVTGCTAAGMVILVDGVWIVVMETK